MSSGRIRLDRPRPRTLLTIGLCSLALGVLSLLPTLRTASPLDSDGTPLRVAIVDVSASRARTQGAAGEYERYLRRALLGFAERARSAEQEVAVVTFAEGAKVLFGPKGPEDLVRRLEGRDDETPLRPRAEDGKDAGSKLDDALRIFEDSLTGSDSSRGAGTIELFLRTGAPPREEIFFEGEHPGPRLARMRTWGVRVLDGDQLTASAEIAELPVAAVDVSVRSLVLPGSVAEGETLALRAEIAFREDHSGRPGQRSIRLNAKRVQVGVPDALNAITHRFDVYGRGEVHFESIAMNLGPVEAGRVEVVVEASLVGEEGRSVSDRFPENDEERGFTRVGDMLTCVVYAPASERTRFEELGRASGIELRFIDAEQANARDGLALALADCDVLCLSNVALDDRSNGVPTRELVSFVENGGGLLVFSGWRTATAWPSRERLEPRSAWSLLPLSPASESGDPRDIVFLVDGSGSMRGEPFDRVRRALFSLAAGAPSDDWMTLYFFTAALTPPIVLAGGEAEDPSGELRRNRLRELLDARVPGGPTEVLSSLERFMKQRGGDAMARDREALVFLLTDGREADPFQVPERTQALRQRFAETKVRLVPVAVGENANRFFLRRLVPTGETLKRAQAFEGLEEIFQREVISERVLESVVQLSAASGGTLAAESPAAITLQALSNPTGGERMVAWRARAQAREGARVLLTAPRAPGESDESEPVLALIERGSGLVIQACFPAQVETLLGENSSLAAGLEPEEILALLRLLGRHSSAQDPRPQLQFTGSDLNLLDVPLAWPVEIRGRVIERAAGLLSEEIELGELSFTIGEALPGLDPRRERVAEGSAGLRVGEAGKAAGRLRLELEASGSGERLAALPWPQAAVASEFELPQAPERRLRLADLLTVPGEDRSEGTGSPLGEGHPWIALVLLAAGLISLVLWAFSRSVPSSGVNTLQS